MAISALSPPVYYLAKSSMKSTAILWALVGNICSIKSYDVVFGKETSIEMLIVNSSGNIESICEQSVFGNIKDMKLLPYNAEFRSSCVQTNGLDLILVLSDSGKISILTFSSEYQRFISISQCHVSPPGSHYRRLGWQLAVDNLGRGTAVSAFEDRIAILPASISSKRHILEKPIIYPCESSIDERNDEEEDEKRITNWGVVLGMDFIISGGTKMHNVDQTVLNSECVYSSSNLVLSVLLMRNDGSYWEIQFLCCDVKRRIISLNGRFAPIEGPLPTHIVSVPYYFSKKKIMLFRCGDIILIDVSNLKSPKIIAHASLNREREKREERKKKKEVVKEEEEEERNVEEEEDGGLGKGKGMVEKIDVFMDVDEESGLYHVKDNASVGKKEREKEGENASLKKNGFHYLKRYLMKKRGKKKETERESAGGGGESELGSEKEKYEDEEKDKMIKHKKMKSNSVKFRKKSKIGSDGLESDSHDLISSTVDFFTAWDWKKDAEKDKMYMILSTSLGQLYFLSLFLSNHGSDEIKLRLLPSSFHSSPLNTLLCLPSNRIISSSLNGDGYFLSVDFQHHQILNQSIIDTCAPISDFCFIDSPQDHPPLIQNQNQSQSQLQGQVESHGYGRYDNQLSQSQSHIESQSQILACCGIGERGSLKFFENSIPVEKLLSTDPSYSFMSGLWSMKRRKKDKYHSFLVMSFLKETRVLSVGFNFNDITDQFGFHPTVHTLACGRVEDEWMVQISSHSVLLCKPPLLSFDPFDPSHLPSGSKSMQGHHPHATWLPSQRADSATTPASSIGSMGGTVRSEWVTQSDDAISIGSVGESVVLISKSKSNSILILRTEDEVNGRDKKLVESQSIDLGTQISCIHVSQGEDKEGKGVQGVGGEGKEKGESMDFEKGRKDEGRNCMEGAGKNANSVKDLKQDDHNFIHDDTYKQKDPSLSDSNIICLAGTYSSTVVILSLDVRNGISIIGKTDINSSFTSMPSLLHGSIPESLVWGKNGKMHYMIVGLRNGVLLKFSVRFGKNRRKKEFFPRLKVNAKGLLDVDDDNDKDKDKDKDDDDDDHAMDDEYHGDEWIMERIQSEVDNTVETKSEEVEELEEVEEVGGGGGGEVGGKIEHGEVEEEEDRGKRNQISSFDSVQDRPSFLLEEDLTLDDMEDDMEDDMDDDVGDHLKSMDIDHSENGIGKNKFTEHKSFREGIVTVMNVFSKNGLNDGMTMNENEKRTNLNSTAAVSANDDDDNDDYHMNEKLSKTVTFNMNTNVNQTLNADMDVNGNVDANAIMNTNMNTHTNNTNQRNTNTNANTNINASSKSKSNLSTHLNDIDHKPVAAPNTHNHRDHHVHDDDHGDQKVKKWMATIELIGIRKLGTVPVNLISLNQRLRFDLICICNRPWLLTNVYHNQNVSYSPISFPSSSSSSTTTTSSSILASPVCLKECENGIVFIADNSFHLVELHSSKKVSTKTIPLGMTPRHVIHHPPSHSIIMLLSHVHALRHHSNNFDSTCNLDHSEIRMIDFHTYAELDKHRLEKGESAISLHLWNSPSRHLYPRQPDQLMVVGTSFRSDAPKHGDVYVCADNGEAYGRGRILIFDIFSETVSTPNPFLASTSAPNSFHVNSQSESSTPTSITQIHPYPHPYPHPNQSDLNLLQTTNERWRFRLLLAKPMLGSVTSTCPLMTHYLLVAAGNSLICYMRQSDDDLLHRMCWMKTRFAISKVYSPPDSNQIYISDCNDGILLYSFDEDEKEFVLLFSDAMHRLVGDFSFFSPQNIFVSDRKSNLCVLTNQHILTGNPNPEKNFISKFHYHLGEICLKNQSRSPSFHYSQEKDVNFNFSKFSPLNSSIILSTMAGSILSFFQLSKEEYEVLSMVEESLSSFFLTSPVLGNDHSKYRSIDRPFGASKVLDGDMLAQFLDLSIDQQTFILSRRQMVSRHVSLWDVASSGPSIPKPSPSPLESVLHILEKIHQSF